LEKVESRLRDEAFEFRRKMTRTDIEEFEDLKDFFNRERGFVRAKWAEDLSSLSALDELGVTVRCLPYDQTGSTGRCVLTGRPATKDAIFAKAY
jgi:prolyl-tRNA synthetase